MLITNIKVASFKVFGPLAELSMVPRTRNYRKLPENLHTYGKKRVLKSAMLYGGNNSGKSSLLDAVKVFKKIVLEGSIDTFSFDNLKNFCYEEGDIQIEVSFLDGTIEYTYGLEFNDKNAIGEYLYENDYLLISRDKEGILEGDLIEQNEKFKERIQELPKNKVILTYVNEYITNPVSNVFIKVKQLCERIHIIDERVRDVIVSNEIIEFASDTQKMALLNYLIASSNLYIEKRELVDEEEAIGSEYLNRHINQKTLEKIKTTKPLLDGFRMVSYYKDNKGNTIARPSVFFDSIGTNKFIVLSIFIINALLDNQILFIDELDSSLHYRLTRVLAIIVNSDVNRQSQFIMTTHDVKLLSPSIFRKDQINFIVRNDKGVEIISMDEFKANSKNDIRSETNFEKLYTEERIVDLPYADVSVFNREIKKLWEQK